MEATDRLERIDRELQELSEVLRELSRSGPISATAARAVPPAVPPPVTPPAPRRPARSAELEAGPFVTLGAVEELHDQISRLPAVADVALRGFAGDRALLDVTLR